jgi:apolipoprotein N-acyltransferase
LKARPQRNIPAAISVAIAAITYFVAALSWSGIFRHGQCGDFGMQCMGQSFIVMAVGCLAGFIVSLVAFMRQGAWRRPIVWVGFLANAVPSFAIGISLAVVVLRMG